MKHPGRLCGMVGLVIRPRRWVSMLLRNEGWDPHDCRKAQHDRRLLGWSLKSTGPPGDGGNGWKWMNMGETREWQPVGNASVWFHVSFWYMFWLGWHGKDHCGPPYAILTTDTMIFQTPQWSHCCIACATTPSDGPMVAFRIIQMAGPKKAIPASHGFLGDLRFVELDRWFSRPKIVLLYIVIYIYYII